MIPGITPLVSLCGSDWIKCYILFHSDDIDPKIPCDSNKSYFNPLWPSPLFITESILLRRTWKGCSITIQMLVPTESPDFVLKYHELLEIALSQFSFACFSPFGCPWFLTIDHLQLFSMSRAHMTITWHFSFASSLFDVQTLKWLSENLLVPLL